MGAIGGSGVSIEEALPISGGTLTDTLIIDQNANASSLDIDAESTSINVLTINADPTTTGRVLNISADGLTTGILAFFDSDSADTSTRNLVFIRNENSLAIGTTALNIRQDAAQRALFIDQNANGSSLVIDSESTTANVISVISATTTTGNILVLASANSLTTGRIANFASDSTSSSARDLVRIANGNSSATGATVLALQQDAAKNFIDYIGTAAANATDPISTLTTSGATTNHIQIEINGVKAWIAVSTTDPS